jgi:hypothetical protein
MRKFLLAFSSFAVVCTCGLAPARAGIKVQSAASEWTAANIARPSRVVQLARTIAAQRFKRSHRNVLAVTFNLDKLTKRLDAANTQDPTLPVLHTSEATATTETVPGSQPGAARAVTLSPDNVNNRCKSTVCMTVHSTGGSGPYIDYWHINATQPIDTEVCNVYGYFYVGPTSGSPYYDDVAQGNPKCVTDGSNEITIWNATDPFANTSFPEYYDPGTQLCGDWTPDPPLTGRVCITVGS